ncbi:MAG TPA: TIGR03618 family F420-dependent PPOX class oxidoreductase [Novosphingobium sp.]
MAKMRDAIRMTEGEIVALLDECKSLQVATLDKDGAPHLTTVWFAYRDGTYLFETYGKSQKVVNLRRDPRVSVLAEQGTEYSELRGVSVQGRAEIVDAGEPLQRLMEVIVARNHRGLDPGDVTKIAASMAEKRVVVIVRPDKVISWDHRKLGMG